MPNLSPFSHDAYQNLQNFTGVADSEAEGWGRVSAYAGKGHLTTSGPSFRGLPKVTGRDVMTTVLGEGGILDATGLDNRLGINADASMDRHYNEFDKSPGDAAAVLVEEEFGTDGLAGSLEQDLLAPRRQIAQELQAKGQLTPAALQARLREHAQQRFPHLSPAAAARLADTTSAALRPIEAALGTAGAEHAAKLPGFSGDPAAYLRGAVRTQPGTDGQAPLMDFQQTNPLYAEYAGARLHARVDKNLKNYKSRFGPLMSIHEKLAAPRSDVGAGVGDTIAAAWDGLTPEQKGMLIGGGVGLGAAVPLAASGTGAPVAPLAPALGAGVGFAGGHRMGKAMVRAATDGPWTPQHIPMNPQLVRRLQDFGNIPAHDPGDLGGNVAALADYARSTQGIYQEPILGGRLARYSPTAGQAMNFATVGDGSPGPLRNFMLRDAGLTESDPLYQQQLQHYRASNAANPLDTFESFLKETAGDHGQLLGSPAPPGQRPDTAVEALLRGLDPDAPPAVPDEGMLGVVEDVAQVTPVLRAAHGRNYLNQLEGIGEQLDPESRALYDERILAPVRQIQDAHDNGAIHLRDPNLPAWYEALMTADAVAGVPFRSDPRMGDLLEEAHRGLSRGRYAPSGNSPAQRILAEDPYPLTYEGMKWLPDDHPLAVSRHNLAPEHLARYRAANPNMTIDDVPTWYQQYQNDAPILADLTGTQATGLGIGARKSHYRKDIVPVLEGAQKLDDAVGVARRFVGLDPLQSAAPARVPPPHPLDAAFDVQSAGGAA